MFLRRGLRFFLVFVFEEKKLVAVEFFTLGAAEEAQELI